MVLSQQDFGFDVYVQQEHQRSARLHMAYVGGAVPGHDVMVRSAISANEHETYKNIFKKNYKRS